MRHNVTMSENGASRADKGKEKRKDEIALKMGKGWLFYVLFIYNV